MQLTLLRDTFHDTCTLGTLTVQGQHFDTLEDVVRETDEPVIKWKIHGSTAIPRGQYEVLVTYSNRFSKYLPELLNVPGFTGIRIHAGNTEKDTEGCILLGKKRCGNSILDSRLAVAELIPLLTAATGRGETITIEVG